MRLGAEALVRGFGGVECKQEASREKDFRRRFSLTPAPPPSTTTTIILPSPVAPKTSGVQGPAPVACVNFIKCVSCKYQCVNL